MTINEETITDFSLPKYYHQQRHALIYLLTCVKLISVDFSVRMVMASRRFFAISNRFTETIIKRKMLISTVKFIVTSVIGKVTVKIPPSEAEKKKAIITNAFATPKPHPIMVPDKSCPTTAKKTDIAAK